MDRITLSVFAAVICLISSAYASAYDDFDDVTYGSNPPAYSPEVGAIIAIVLIVVIIKVAITCCIFCYCCAWCPCYHWCHPNSTTQVTIVQPPGYPATPGQNNFNFSAVQLPQQVIHQHLPPNHDPTGYNRLVETADCELGYTQHQ